MAYGNTSIICSNGVDIGQECSAYVSGTKAPVSKWIAANGNELSNILMPLSGAQQIPTTGLWGPDGRDLALYYGSGGPVGTLPLGDVEAISSASHGSGNITAACNAIVNPDGTWNVNPVSSGNPSGNWYLPTTSGIGSSYWVRFSYTTQGGTLGTFSVTNQASNWTQITGTLVLTLSLTFGAGGTATASRYGTMTIQIASDSGGNNIVSQGTCNWRDECDITA